MEILREDVHAIFTVAFHDIPPETPVYEKYNCRTKASIFGQRLSYIWHPEAEPDIESGLQGACLFVPLTGVRSRGAGGGAVVPPSCQPSGPKPRKIFILLGLDIFRFVT